jgi:hypothetical protein
MSDEADDPYSEVSIVSDTHTQIPWIITNLDVAVERNSPISRRLQFLLDCCHDPGHQ